MNIPDLSLPQDDQTMRLPHPLRCAVCLTERDIAAWRGFLGARTWGALTQEFQAQDGLTGDALLRLTASPEHARLSMLTETLSHSEGNTEMGSAFSVMLYLRQLQSPQPHFLIEDALTEMLEHTDIADDIPVSMLALPFPRCYVEFGRRRELLPRVPNPLTGLHTLEGAYIETGVSEARGKGIFVMLTGSPLGHHDAMDDATCSLFIPTTDPERPLRDALLDARRASGALALDLGLRAAPEEYFEHEMDALKLLAKALLYLNLPQARKTLRKELTEAKLQVAAKKNPAKRAKAEKELRRLSDYILVSAPPPQSDVRGSGTGKSLRMHWRRGHYRLQRHGIGNSLQKLIFLQPALIGAADSDATAPAGRYVAKA